MADAADSKSADGDIVWVQLPSSALKSRTDVGGFFIELIIKFSIKLFLKKCLDIS